MESFRLARCYAAPKEKDVGHCPLLPWGCRRVAVAVSVSAAESAERWRDCCPCADVLGVRRSFLTPGGAEDLYDFRPGDAPFAVDDRNNAVFFVSGRGSFLRLVRVPLFHERL